MYKRQLFNYGAFQADDVLKTRDALMAYSVGLTGLILVKVLALSLIHISEPTRPY